MILDPSPSSWSCSGSRNGLILSLEMQALLVFRGRSIWDERCSRVQLSSELGICCGGVSRFELFNIGIGVYAEHGVSEGLVFVGKRWKDRLQSLSLRKPARASSRSVAALHAPGGPG